MKKVLFFIAIAAATLTSCDFVNQLKGAADGKSEEEIRKEVEAELQHKQDSIRLAEAEARAAAAEDRAEEAMAAAEEAAEKAEQAANAAASRATATGSTRVNGVSGNPYAWLSQRAVTSNDLYGLSKSDLRILRNAIYAMHNYKFQSADLLQYFSQYSWYFPQYSNVEGSLSKIERQNVATIKSWE